MTETGTKDAAQGYYLVPPGYFTKEIRGDDGLINGHQVVHTDTGATLGLVKCFQVHGGRGTAWLAVAQTSQLWDGEVGVFLPFDLRRDAIERLVALHRRNTC